MKTVKVDLTTKDGSWQYRNLLDLTKEEVDNIESIYFHSSEDLERQDLPVKREVTPKWIGDIMERD